MDDEYLSYEYRRTRSSRQIRDFFKLPQSYKPAPIQKTRQRAILKNGDCNIIQSKMSSAWIRFLQDIFTTLVECNWFCTLITCTLLFFITWLIYALLWCWIAFRHGDFKQDHLPLSQKTSNWMPCITNIYGFSSCFLFSIEIQHTIGFGSRTITDECPDAIIIMCVQCLMGLMLQAFVVSIILNKMSRSKRGPITLLFSKYAVISHRDGNLKLMFRVGDLRMSNVIGARVRAQLIRPKTTVEGLVFPNYQTELQLHVDGCDSNLFFIWPITVLHSINKQSPFYSLSAADIYQDTFEIIVILNGTIGSTGQQTQGRSSYTNSEILWGHKFVPIVTYDREHQGYRVDFSKFEDVLQVETHLCSVKELDENGENNSDSKSRLTDLLQPSRSKRWYCRCHKESGKKKHVKTETTL